MTYKNNLAKANLTLKKIKVKKAPCLRTVDVSIKLHLPQENMGYMSQSDSKSGIYVGRKSQSGKESTGGGVITDVGK